MSTLPYLILALYRFCPLPEIVALNSLPFCRGVPFADNAKQLLVPLLGMPSPSVTAALLLMSYYELGMNSRPASGIIAVLR